MNSEEKTVVCKSCGKAIGSSERAIAVEGGLLCTQCEQRLPVVSNLSSRDTSPAANQSLPSARIKQINWAKVGANVGGGISVVLLLLLQIWRSGAIAIMIFTFVCVGIGAAIGAGIEHFSRNRNQ